MQLPVIQGNGLSTHSRRQCFKLCKRKHYYRYLLGLRRKETAKPLRFGSAFHIGLDLRAKGHSVDESIELAIASYDKTPDWCKTDEDRFDWQIERVQVACLLQGYFWFWERDADNALPPDITVAEMLQSEGAFDQPIRNPETGAASSVFRAAGKRDKIVKLADGRVAVMEHKTTGDDIEPDSFYWKKLKIDEQISAYVLAARTEGFDAETVLYDVARKPSIGPLSIPLLDENNCKVVVDKATGERVFLDSGKPRQSGDAAKGWVLQSRKQTPDEYAKRLMDDIGSRPDRYYARQNIPRMETDIEEFKDELWQTQQDMRDAMKRGRHYKNTGACSAFGSVCEYLDKVCPAGLHFDRVPDGFEIVGDLHPELSTETA